MERTKTSALRRSSPAIPWGDVRSVSVDPHPTHPSPAVTSADDGVATTGESTSSHRRDALGVTVRRVCLLGGES